MTRKQPSVLGQPIARLQSRGVMQKHAHALTLNCSNNKVTYAVNYVTAPIGLIEADPARENLHCGKGATQRRACAA